MEFIFLLTFFQVLIDSFVYVARYSAAGDTVITVEQRIEWNLQSMWIGLYIALAVFLVALIFGGLGLYKIAKKTNTPHAWMGFVPFLNTWYAGKIAGEANFFGQKMKRAGLYAMLIEILYVGLSVLTTVLEFFLTKPEYYTFSEEEGLIFIGRGVVPEMYDTYVYGGLIANLLRFMMIIFLFVVYIAFFRKYYARSPLVMSILCAFLPVRGFILFAVRNNAPVDYNAYMRRRAEEYARRNAPYGGYGQGATPQENPFSEFGESGPHGGNDQNGNQKDDDPFSEFH